MKRCIAKRNSRLGVVARPLRVLLVLATGWSDDSTASYRGWSLDLRKILRFSLLLKCALDAAPDREPWKRLPSWWAYGAFFTQGRLYGAQYLAGRRAPPFFLSL